MGSPVPRTAFLGLSHLGLVSSVGWASFGRQTVGVDVNPGLIDLLRRDVMPLDEPGLQELRGRVGSALTFTTDVACVAECPIVIVAKDTPTNERNEGDPSIIEALLDRAIPHLRQEVTVVLMSQVPVGFSRGLRERICTARPGLDFELVYWVETLVIGNAVERYLQPERIILGHRAPGVSLAPGFERALQEFGCPVFSMSYESAELTKMAINLYLAAAVTYTNTMADLCETVSADWTELVPALQADARIGKSAYLRPGLGIAGGNLERDLVVLRRLCASQSVDSALVDLILGYNERRFDWIRRKLATHLFSEAVAPTVCIWGLAYKKGTGSTKNSPSLRLMAMLKGVARVQAYDPVVRLGMAESDARLFEDRYEALDGADCLVIMTDWDEFKTVDLGTVKRRMRRPLVIDCVNAWAGYRPQPGDVAYVAMGMGSDEPPTANRGGRR